MKNEELDNLMRSYFRERIDGGSPGAQGRAGNRGRSEVAVWIARFALAAALVIAVYLPFSALNRNVPAATAYGSALERTGTTDLLEQGLMQTRAIIRLHFEGGNQ